jgi:YidC/Oxa1 family membrane protein insertase
VEMEKRLILAVALSVVIYAVFMWFMAPPVPQHAPSEARPQESTGEPPPTAPESRPREPLSQGASSAVTADSEQLTDVDAGVFHAVLTNRGARVTSWLLTGYGASGGPLEAFAAHVEGPSRNLAFDVDDPGLASELADALFRVERESLPEVAGSSSGERITFSYSNGNGLEAHRQIVTHHGSYLVEISQEVRENGRLLPSRVSLGPGFATGESRSSYSYNSQALWNVGGTVSRRAAGKLDDSGRFTGSVRWAGLEDQYFAALLVPGGVGTEVAWTHTSITPLPAPSATPDKSQKAVSRPTISVSVPEGGLRLFVGPKSYQLLRGLGDELDKAIWFSSMEWLQPIVKYLFLGLIWIHDHVVANWGWAIILATVALRVFLFPINQYSMISMKKTQLQMQKLQPKVKAIRARYTKKKDAQARAKMNQEMMDLYKEEGVNPMGGLSGCLPLLAQFPILIGFYNMLTVAVELRGAPFIGWIRDLSMQDPIWVTPILMTATMFFQQKLAMTKVKDPQQLQQQRIMLFMPVMFGVICLQMPSGLVLYWFVNNLLGIGQQWLVNRHSSRLEAALEKA